MTNQQQVRQEQHDVLPMLERLKVEAVRRDLVAKDAELSHELVFSLVRDMPYRRASSRQPEVVIQEWQATCSGKHYLLQSLFRELGYQCRVIMCTHQFKRQNTRHFPDYLRELVAEGPVPDVHTFIRIRTGALWMDVDATWPRSAESLGMPVNSHFQLGVNMTIACDPIEIFEVPPNIDPQVFKEELIDIFCKGQSEQRDQFIEGLSLWLAENTS